MELGTGTAAPHLRASKSPPPSSTYRTAAKVVLDIPWMLLLPTKSKTISPDFSGTPAARKRERGGGGMVALDMDMAAGAATPTPQKVLPSERGMLKGRGIPTRTQNKQVLLLPTVAIPFSLIGHFYYSTSKSQFNDATLIPCQ